MEKSAEDIFPREMSIIDLVAKIKSLESEIFCLKNRIKELENPKFSGNLNKDDGINFNTKERR
jgi:hypothetical protein